MAYWSDGGNEDSRPSGVVNSGRWTREEHQNFLAGLQLHGKEWKKIADMIKTRTVVQIRTHAQKYFQKVAKHTGGPVMSTSKKEDVVKQPSSGKKRKHYTTSYKNNSDEERTVHLDLIPPKGKPENIQLPSNNRDSRRLSPPMVDRNSGGATPRTVAAATILLRPRLQQRIAANASSMDTPKTRDAYAWMEVNQEQAQAVLAKRRSTTPVPTTIADQKRRSSGRATSRSALSWENAS